MYIRSAHIQNIKSIEDFKMNFEEGQEAGWHVVIGENGSGKTTLLRALALGLMGETDYEGHPRFYEVHLMLRKSQVQGRMFFVFSRDKAFDTLKAQREPKEPHRLLDYDLPPFATIPDWLLGDQIVSIPPNEVISNLKWLLFQGEKQFGAESSFNPYQAGPTESKENFACGQAVLSHVQTGYFAAAYGTHRRMYGGRKEYLGIKGARPRLARMLTLLVDDAQLLDFEDWLMLEYTRKLEDAATSMLDFMYKYINGNGEAGLLPDGTHLLPITSKGVFFKMADGTEVAYDGLSEGYKSALLIAFDLLHELREAYGPEVFKDAIDHETHQVLLPGVVFIDEADAHLHPTWQTKIGQWFTRYFPKLQFIVTTHSPLICRACGENGKIFRLAAPGSSKPSGEITGIERDRLVYGDILEAYETDAFGDGVEWSAEGKALQKEYRDLIYKQRFGVALEAKEQERLNHLRQIFHSNVEAH